MSNFLKKNIHKNLNYTCPIQCFYSHRSYWIFPIAFFEVQANPVYSIGNGFIVAFGLYRAIQLYKSEKGIEFEYQKGFMAGLFAGFNATIIFTVFFAIYISHINPNFLPAMLENWSAHYHVGLGIVVFMAAVMGFATTFVLTLSFMQLFKDSWNLKRNSRDSRLVTIE